MALSKTKYCKALQCKKWLWLLEHHPLEEEENSVFDTGKEVGELAKNLLGPHIDVRYNEDLKEMLKDTKSLLLLNNVVITEASFLYESLFCSVDLLKKRGDSFEVYEVKSSTEVKDIYLEDLAYQVYILNHLGYKIDKACIVYINKEYERFGELDLSSLFVISDETSVILAKQGEVEENIKKILEYQKKEEEEDEKIGIHCVKPYPCPYFEYCTKGLKKPNVFDLRGIRDQKKFDWYDRGVISYEDLLKEEIDPKTKQQIEFELKDKEPFIDKEQIIHFMDTLSYPLYFLDFETFQQAIPLYDGIKPYMQIPFQYSLHSIESKDAPLKHTEFLDTSGLDPRRNLALQLVKDIPKDSCVLAYNMRFEKMVIKNLASLYPDLKEDLMRIHDSIKDLMFPFVNRFYYQKEMKGSYSIKQVLPSLFPEDPALDYHNLEQVHNGSEAMNAYQEMNRLGGKEKEDLIHNMLKYCELDTFAMVKIWTFLNEIVLAEKEAAMI